MPLPRPACRPHQLIPPRLNERATTVPYQLHLGLGDDLEKFLKAYAGARGITVAAAVRVILYEAKKNEEDKP